MTDDPLRVLVVDDQRAVVDALGVLFDLEEIPWVSASDPDEALEIASSETLGAVVQDMNFEPDETSGARGVELFRRMREEDPDLPVVLITAWASLETAVELVRDGAVDYVQKPWDDDKLVATIRNLLRMRRLVLENEELRREVRRSRAELAEDYELCDIVYASEAMHRVVSMAVNVADSDAPVLVTGPSGAGKELIAEILQANSPRREGPFVKVNIGAIPEELMEAELFGAEAGAYTGLRSRRIGHFETADGGTLFLDEVDTLSLSGQVKLLRVLQSGEFQRLGSSRTLRADVRVLSASNARLDVAVEEGRFRDDLFYRLNVVELRVPALAERPDDVLPLARHFLSRFAAERGEPLRYSAEAEGALRRYDWPGNVRELENRVRRASLVAPGSEIAEADLGLGAAEGSEVPQDLSEDEMVQRERLLSVLEEEQGVVTKAAERLGISRQALYRRMDKLGVEVERRPKG